jgi:hypothetical protein
VRQRGHLPDSEPASRAPAVAPQRGQNRLPKNIEPKQLEQVTVANRDLQ